MLVNKFLVKKILGLKGNFNKKKCQVRKELFVKNYLARVNPGGRVNAPPLKITKLKSCWFVVSLGHLKKILQGLTLKQGR